MKVYPTRTGALCAKMDRGLSGQDAFNDMLPVIRRRNEMAMCRERTIASDVNADGNEHAGLYARSANCFEVGGTSLDENNGRKYVIRRLTPLECCRLQGFPDWWTDGVEGSDSARYKMWGNGIALPCAADVIGRIAKEMEKDIPFDDPPPNGCWNCLEYNGDFCMKYWNNADECYKDVYRDAKEPNDYCEDHEIDRDAVWEDYFGEELF